MALKDLGKFSSGECSELFASAFATLGALRQTVCEACGRVHFIANEDLEWHEEEYEELINKSKVSPERYLPHYEGCSIHHGIILQMDVVHGCQCGFDAYIEPLLWNDLKYWLMEYYVLPRADQEKKEAENVANLAKTATTAIKTT